VAGVAPDSQVETFAAMRFSLDSWRWSGVPFYLRTGKCLPITATEVLITLRQPPLNVFGGALTNQPNYIRFRLHTSPYDAGSCRHSMIGVGAVRTVQQGLPTATPNTAFRSVSCSRPADGDHRMSARPDAVHMFAPGLASAPYPAASSAKSVSCVARAAPPRTRRVGRHTQHLEPVPLAQDPER